MIRKYILINREPVEVSSVEEWGTWFERSREQRKVEQTELPGKVLVSTVFIGIDHAFRDDKRPLIFETMIFGGPHDGELERCSTWAEAINMHKSLCALARTGLVTVL